MPHGIAHMYINYQQNQVSSSVEYVHTYIFAKHVYIICFVHNYGVFCYVMGGGGGTVVSVYSYCIMYVLLFDEFCNKIFLYIHCKIKMLRSSVHCNYSIYQSISVNRLD